MTKRADAPRTIRRSTKIRHILLNVWREHHYQTSSRRKTCVALRPTRNLPRSPSLIEIVKLDSLGKDITSPQIVSRVIISHSQKCLNCFRCGRRHRARAGEMSAAAASRNYSYDETIQV